MSNRTTTEKTMHDSNEWHIVLDSTYACHFQISQWGYDERPHLDAILSMRAMDGDDRIFVSSCSSSYKKAKKGADELRTFAARLLGFADLIQDTAKSITWKEEEDTEEETVL